MPPKKKTSAKKNKRGKKTISIAMDPGGIPRPDPKRRDGDPRSQMYGLAIKVMGGPHVSVKCEGNVTRIAHIPRKLKLRGNRNRITPGTLLLLGIREYEQHGMLDIIYIYRPEEAKWLQRHHELVGLLDEDEQLNDNFEFGIAEPTSDEEGEAPATGDETVYMPMPTAEMPTASDEEESEEINLEDL